MATSVAILCVGTELTRGELVNTNGSWLAQQLSDLGFVVAEIAVVPDVESAIETTLERLAARCQIIVCTGGLGPTTDDLTTACAARVLEVPLVRDPGSLERIEAHLSRLGRPMAASNVKQADFPRGARILPNQWGTAPGFAVRIGRADVFFLPGVPSEMKNLFETAVCPAIAPQLDEHVVQVRLRTFGMGESAVNDRLAGVEAEAGVVIGYRARLPEVEVKVLARGTERATAERRARAGAALVADRLGPDVVFGEGDVSLGMAVGQLLIERNLSLAAAESCTGGLLGSWLTDAPGASQYFLGSAVVYSNEAKHRILAVPRQLLEQHGAVSPEAAQAMAEGARRAYGAEVGVSVTGIAGPEGGTHEKPVGLVHLGVALPESTVTRRLVAPGSRDRVRRIAAAAALAFVRHALLARAVRQS